MMNHVVDMKIQLQHLMKGQERIEKEILEIKEILLEEIEGEDPSTGNGLGGFQDRLFTLINQNPTAAAQFAKALGFNGESLAGFFTQKGG